MIWSWVVGDINFIDFNAFIYRKTEILIISSRFHDFTSREFVSSAAQLLQIPSADSKDARCSLAANDERRDLRIGLVPDRLLSTLSPIFLHPRAVMWQTSVYSQLEPHMGGFLVCTEKYIFEDCCILLFKIKFNVGWLSNKVRNHSLNHFRVPNPE